MSHSTTVLFGLSGVRVQRVEQVEFGGRAVHVETSPDTAASGCPGCGVVSTSVKELVTTAPRDIPYGETGITTHLTTQFNLGKGTVLRILQANQVDMRNQPLTAEQTVQAIELYQQGWSLARVAEYFNVSTGNVHDRIRQASIPTRNTHGRDR